MPGLGLDPDGGRVGVGTTDDVQDGFVAVGGVFDGDDEGGLFGLRDGAPTLWEEVGGVSGGEGVVEGGEVLGGEVGGEVGEEEVVVVAEWKGSG